MRTIQRTASLLLLIDLQTRLMPAIADAENLLRETKRILQAAQLLQIPVIVTEQNPTGLGPTVEGLLPLTLTPIAKMTFDACPAPGFAAALGTAEAVVVAGCEAHVCVLQTVLGLLDTNRRVFVVADAVGSRTRANRDAALARMAAHGAELVTAEMVAFEWIQTAADPRFRDLVHLVK